MYDLRGIVVVWSLFDDQDGEVRVGVRETASNNATGKTTCFNKL